MNKTSTADGPAFTAEERELVRAEFHPRFGQTSSIHDGIILRRWTSGPDKGRPKLSGPVQRLLDRGLAVLCEDGSWPRAAFTAAGLAALRALLANRRYLDRETHAALIDEIEALPD